MRISSLKSLRGSRMTHKVLLKHLDSPVRILSLSINDMVGYAGPFFVGGMFDSLLIIPLCGLLLVYFLKKTLRKFPRFHFIRYLYWELPTSRYNKLLRVNLPESANRLWVK